MIPKEAPPPKISLIRYSDKTHETSVVEDVELLKNVFRNDHRFWIDVQGFGDRTVMRRIGEIFDLHPLLLADVVNVPQRPKTEPYDNQLLMIVRMAYSFCIRD